VPLADLADLYRNATGCFFNLVIWRLSRDYQIPELPDLDRRFTLVYRKEV
jgi:hypothetical protein